MPNIENFYTPEEYREWYRKYREKNRKKLRNYNKEYIHSWRLSYGIEKDNVRKKVFYAIRKGILKRGNCEICGKDGAEGHHFDYGKPLDLIWLCPVHHKQMHLKK